MCQRVSHRQPIEAQILASVAYSVMVKEFRVQRELVKPGLSIYFNHKAIFRDALGF